PFVARVLLTITSPPRVRHYLHSHCKKQCLLPFVIMESIIGLAQFIQPTAGYGNMMKISKIIYNGFVPMPSIWKRLPSSQLDFITVSLPEHSCWLAISP